METFIQAVSIFFTTSSVPESVLMSVILPLLKGKGAKANNKDNYWGLPYSLLSVKFMRWCFLTDGKFC